MRERVPSNTGQARPAPGQRQPTTYYVNHRFGGPAELSTTLVHALSNLAGVDVTETESTLFDHVDPDALNALFEPKPDGTPRTDASLGFTMWGYQVTVTGSGQITITVPQQPHSQSM